MRTHLQSLRTVASRARQAQVQGLGSGRWVGLEAEMWGPQAGGTSLPLLMPSIQGPPPPWIWEMGLQPGAVA